jgi:hypothetical protein
MARERRKSGPRPRPKVCDSIAHLEEMLLRAMPVIGQEHPQLRAIVRAGLTALCNAWAAYSLKRAMADVAGTSEQDYRHFGLDKAEILQALSRLHDEIGASRSQVAEGPGGDGSRCALAIEVSKAPRRSQSIGA